MKTKLFFTLLTAALLFVACAPATPAQPTPDVQVIRTSAASTVMAEFTLTAAVFTPTSQPPTETPTQEIAQPTNTALPVVTDPTQLALTPAALCDNYSFDLSTLDVTIPDGTPMTPGQDFTKTWKIKNTGICTWDTGYKPIFAYSNPPNERMGAQPIPLTTLVAPGEEVDVSVQFKAPTTPGEYSGYWQMVNSKGISFGDKDHILVVKIVVQ
jgi:hypothetical protein